MGYSFDVTRVPVGVEQEAINRDDSRSSRETGALLHRITPPAHRPRRPGPHEYNRNALAEFGAVGWLGISMPLVIVGFPLLPCALTLSALIDPHSSWGCQRRRATTTIVPCQRVREFIHTRDVTRTLALR